MIGDAVASARAVRAALGDAAPAALRELLAAVDGDGAAWRRAAQGAWREPRLRARLVPVPGLRTAVRRAAVGAIEPAIADLVAQRVVAARPEAALVVSDGERLWLPDLVFPELAFDLEIDQAGGIRGEEPAPPAARWRRFVAWAADGAPLARGHVAHPRWPGAFPAWGLPASAPRVRPIAHALRGAATGPTAIVADPARALAAWWDGRLPTAEDVLGEDDFAVSATRDALVGARERWAACAGALARRGGDALTALAALARDGVILTLTAARRDGTLRRAPPLARGAPPLIAHGQDDALVVEPEGLAGVLAWLGLAPTRYDLKRGIATWDFATLAACGWSALVAAGHWRWSAAPVAAAAPWLALDARAVTRPAAAPSARCAMRLELAD